MEKELSIQIQKLPMAEDLDDFERGDTFEYDVMTHLAKEFDSKISFEIQGKDILSGYEGAFVYPVYTFLKNLNNGVVSLLEQHKVSIPIFLQQYAFFEHSPQHTLNLSIPARQNDKVQISFHWYNEVPVPQQLPKIENEIIHLEILVTEVLREVEDYGRAISKLLRKFSEFSQSEIDEIFSDFRDIRRAWRKYKKL
jgi:hypothetical protein